MATNDCDVTHDLPDSTSDVIITSHRARQPQPITCARCRYSCTENVSEQQRHVICQLFHDLRDVRRQRQFVLDHVVQCRPRAIMAGARGHRAYHLPVDDTGRVRVCRRFFTSTLDITTRTIDKWLKPSFMNKMISGVEDDEDGEIWTTATVHEHIGMFPAMKSLFDPSHQYLEFGLDTEMMYKCFQEFWTNLTDSDEDHDLGSLALVKERLHAGGIPSEEDYKLIFHRDFNLHLLSSSTSHQVCSECSRSQQQSLTFSRHQLSYPSSVFVARRTVVTATVQLRHCLPIPTSTRHSMFYRRKLLVHNMTVEDDLSSRVCFLWPETQGRYTVTEIGSAVFRYLTEIASSDVELHLPRCTKPFQKQRLAAVLLYAINSLRMSSISITFARCRYCSVDDCLQVAVEHAQRHLSVFSLHDWVNVIKSANRTHLYEVIQLTNDDFYDLRRLSDEMLSNTNHINWTEIRRLRVDRSLPWQLSYATSPSQHTFDSIELKISSAEIRPAYEGPIAISSAKKRDLMALCDNQDVPDIYHEFYRSLPSDCSVVDMLPAFTDEG